MDKMDPDRENHLKEFNTNMFNTCFNECVQSFTSTNLTPAEGKCLKNCYVTFSKKLAQTATVMGYEAKLAYEFK